MKAVLMAIHPKWCEKIFNGKKTIEVRITAPQLATPFKVYVYRTKCKRRGIIGSVLNDLYYGKVIGEFVCDRVDDYTYDYCDGVDIDDDSLLETCLEWDEINIYANGEKLHGLHITAPKRYDTPKELSEFSRYGYKKIEHKGSGYVFCDNTQCRYCEPDEVMAGLYRPPVCRKGGCKITRAPQSWCYVEEIEE